MEASYRKFQVEHDGITRAFEEQRFKNEKIWFEKTITMYLGHCLFALSSGRLKRSVSLEKFTKIDKLKF